MRHVFSCTLLWFLPIPVPAQTTRSLPEPSQARGSDFSTSSAQLLDWENRLVANDPKVRASAEAALVQGAWRSLPLLRRFLDSGNEDLALVAFDIIRRIGPPAIPLLVDLLRDERVSIRRSAADALIDLAPDTESIQPALCRALGDEDLVVAGDAARALGALGRRPRPSVPALVKALSHRDPHVRLYAAEALASIGPAAAATTRTWSGPWAIRSRAFAGRRARRWRASARPRARRAAVDRGVEGRLPLRAHLRRRSAGQHRAEGPTAREALREAAKDPTLHAEAEWALNRIAGSESGEPAASSTRRAVRLPSRHDPDHVAHTGNPPVDWDTSTGRNIAWSVELGGETFGRPVVSGGVVYVGTDNARR